MRGGHPRATLYEVLRNVNEALRISARRAARLALRSEGGQVPPGTNGHAIRRYSARLTSSARVTRSLVRRGSPDPAAGATAGLPSVMTPGWLLIAAQRRSRRPAVGGLWLGRETGHYRGRETGCNEVVRPAATRVTEGVSFERSQLIPAKLGQRIKSIPPTHAPLLQNDDRRPPQQKQEHQKHERQNGPNGRSPAHSQGSVPIRRVQ